MGLTHKIKLCTQRDEIATRRRDFTIVLGAGVFIQGLFPGYSTNCLSSTQARSFQQQPWCMGVGIERTFSASEKVCFSLGSAGLWTHRLHVAMSGQTLLVWSCLPQENCTKAEGGGRSAFLNGDSSMYFCLLQLSVLLFQ